VARSLSEASSGGAYSLTKSGLGILDLNPSSSNTFSGGINVNAGTLLLDYSNVSGQTNLLNTNNLLTLSGGTLLLKGKSSGASGQTFGSPTLTAAGSQILINPNGGTSTTLVLGSLTNNAATGAALLVGTVASAGAGSAVITTTDTTVGGIYDPMIVFTTNGASTNVSWATTVSGGSPYTISGSNATATLPASGATSTNYLLTGSQTLTANETINSLEMTNSSLGGTLALGGNTLTITSGGILNNNGGTATNGTISAGSTYGYNLVFQQYYAGTYNFGAAIANNGANAVSLTKAGPGTLNLTASNSYTGNTYIDGGVLDVLTGGVINSGTGTITVGNGTLTLGGGTITTAALIVTNGNSAFSTNSAFTFTSGTLNTTNASNAIAAYIILGTNVTFTYGGTWNMNGGSNIILPSQTQTNGGGGYNIGSSAPNSSVNVNSNATLVLGTAGIGSTAGTNANLSLQIGGGVNTNDSLTVNGGIVTNVDVFYIASSSNSLAITNGGQLYITALNSVGNLSFQLNGSSNTVTIIDTNTTGNSILNGGGNRVSFANGGGYNSNIITIGQGGLVTNGILFLQGATNTFTITNGGLWMELAGQGNTLARQATNDQILIGGTNPLNGSNSIYNGGNASFGLGISTSNSYSNSVIVSSGGIITNISYFLLAGGVVDSNNINESGNQIIVTNGGQVWNNASTTTTNTIAFNTNDNSNSITVAGTNSAGASALWNAGGNAINIGNTNSTANTLNTNNSVNILTGGILTNAGVITILGVTNSFNLSGTAYVNGVNLSNTTATLNITNGTLVANSNNANLIYGSGTVTFTSNSTINDATYNVTNSAINVGTGTLTVTGTTGTLTISNTGNTYSGGTILSGGTLVVGSASALGASSGTINDAGGTLNLSNINVTAGAVTLGNGTITGTGTLTSTGYTATNSTLALISASLAGTAGFTNNGTTGSGVTILTASNTYAGVTTISGGLLEFQNSNSLYAGSNSYWTNDANIVVQTNGTVAYSVGTNTGAFTSNNIATFLGYLTNSTNLAFGLEAGGYFGLDATGTNFTNVNVLTHTTNNGAIGFASLGSGTITVNIANTYTGGTLISGGTLVIGNATALGATTGAINDAGGTLNLSTYGVTAGAVSIGNGTITGTGTLTGTGYTATNNGAALISEILAGGSTVGLTNSGTGTLTISTANTYTGGTVLNAGLLTMSNATAIGGSGTITFGGGILGFSASNTNDYSARFSTAASQKYSFDTAGQIVRLGAAALNSSGGSLTLTNSTGAGAGNLTLTGANTYAGGTTVNGGTLVVGNASALGATSGNITAAGGTLNLSNNNITAGTVTVGNGTITGTGTLTGTGYTGNSTSGQFGLVSESLGGSVGLTNSGTGTLALAASNSYTGNTILNSGSLAVSNSFAFGAGTVTFASNTAVTGSTLSGLANVTITNNYSISTNVTATFIELTNTALTNSGVISGGGSITQSGTGTLVLSGANTYSGATLVSGAALIANNSSAFGTSTIYTTNANAQVEFGTGGTVFTNTFVINGGGVTGQGIIENISSGNVTLSNNTILSYNGASGGSTFASLGTGTLIIYDPIIAVNAIATPGWRQGYGIIAGGGSYTNFIVSGTNTLGANNGYATNTTLQIGFSGTGEVDMAGYSQTIRGLGNNGNVYLGLVSNSVSATNSVLTLNTTATNASQLYLGNIAGNITLNASGNGTQTFSGTNTYSGVTTISGGVLEFQTANSLYGGSNSLWTAANIVVQSNGTVAFGVGTNSNAFTTSNITTLLGNLTNSTNVNNGLLAGSSFGLDATGTNFTLTNNLANTTGTGGGQLGLYALGAGVVTVNGTNTYTGPTVISGGALEFQNSNSLYGGSNALWNAQNLIVQTNGTVAFSVGTNAGAFTTSNITAILGSIGGAVTNNGLEAGSYIGFDATGTNFTLTNLVTNTFGVGGGAVGIASLGSGTLTITNANTYSGNTLLYGGTLAISNSAALGTGTITFTNNGNATISALAALNVTNNYAIGTNSTATFTEASGVSLTNSGVIAGSGSITETGGGTLTLTANNTYTGTTLITNNSTLVIGGGTTGRLGSGTDTIASGSTLNLSSTNSLANGGITINGAGTLEYSGGSTISPIGGNTNFIYLSAGGLVWVTGNTTVIGSTSGRGNWMSNMASFQIDAGSTFNGVESGATSNGVLQMDALNGGGSLNWGFTTYPNQLIIGAANGSGTFSGTITYTGTNTGLFEKTGTGTETLTGSLTNSGATNTVPPIYIAGGVLVLSNTGSINGGSFSNNITNNGGFVDASSANQTLSGLVSGTGTLTQNGPGTLTLAGTSFSNSIVDSGPLAIGATGATVTIAGNISGTGSLTQNGTGTVILSGSNSYSGKTVLSGGLFEFQTANSLYGGSNSLWTAANIVVPSGDAVAFGVGTLSGTFTTNNINTVLSAIDGVVTNNGLESGSSIGFDATGTNFTLTNNLANTTGTGGGAVGLVSAGTGTLILSGANTYSGISSIKSGTIEFQNAGSLYDGSNSLWTAGNIIVQSGGTLAFGVGAQSGAFTTSNITTLLGNLAGAVTNNGIEAGGIIAFDATGANFTLTNTLANTTGTGGGALALGTAGTGTVTISASNTYTGGTYVTSGTLAVGNTNALGNTNASIYVTGGTLSAGAYNIQLGNFSVGGNGTYTGTGTLSESGGTGTLTGNGVITVAELLVTNGNTTNSILSSFALLNGGTLNTTNATNAMASWITVASNGAFVNNGIWNMNGGTNLIAPVSTNNNVAGNFVIGQFSTNAQVTVNAGAVLSLGTNANTTNTGATNDMTIVIGQTAGALSNSLVVNGGLVTNVQLINLGSVAGVTNSQLIITNGGQVYSGWSTAGGTAVLQITANYSSVIIGGTNSSGGLSIFNGDAQRFNLVGAGDQLLVSGGGVVTNAQLYVYGISNTATITNGGQIYTAASLPFGRGAFNDQLLIGSTTTTNSILAGTNGATFSLQNGGNTASSFSNVIQVGSGGIITNVNNIQIGGNQIADTNENANLLVITNGGQLYQVQNAAYYSIVGWGFNDNSNAIILGGTNAAGSNSLWNAGSNPIYIGNNPNTYTVSYITTNAGVTNTNFFTNSSLAITTTNNSVQLFAGGLLTNGGLVTIGGTNGSNYFNVYGGTGYVGGVNLGSTNNLTNTTGLSATNPNFATNPITATNLYTNVGYLNFASNGTLFATNNGNFIYGTGTVTFTGNGTINNNSFSITNSATNTGVGTLTSAGTGSLTLTASNSYGGMIVNGGTVVVGNANALGITNGTLNVAAGTLNAGTYNITEGAVSLGNGSITGSGTLTGTGFTATNTGNAAITENIAGIGNFTQSGTGITALSASALTGNMTVNAGTLYANAPGGTGTLSISGGAFGYSTTNSTLNIAELDMLGSGTIYLTNGVVSATGNANISGSGNVINLTGSESAGSTNNIIYATNALTTSAGISITGSAVSGQVLALYNSVLVGRTTYTLTNTANAIQLILGGGAWNIYYNTNTGNGLWDTNPAYTNNWTATTNGGTNTSFFTGDNVNFTNAVTINVDDISGGVTAGNINVSNNSGTITITNGTITANSFTNSGSGTLVVSNSLSLLGGGSFVNNGSGSVSLAGAFSTSGQIQQLGTGTMVLSASNSYSGGTIVSAGALVATNANAIGSGSVLVNGGLIDLGGNTFSNAFTLSSGTIQNGTITNSGQYTTITNGTASATLAGALGLTESGTGTLVLAGSNSFTGVTLNSGTIVVSNTYALGNVAGALSVASGATLTNSSFNDTVGSVTLGNGTISGAGTLTSANGFTVTNSGAALISENLAGTGGFTNSGGGTLTLSGVTSFTGGPILISGGSTMIAAANNSLSGTNSPSSSAYIYVYGGSVLKNLAGVTNQLNQTLVIGQGNSNALVTNAGVLILNGTNVNQVGWTGGGTNQWINSGTIYNNGPGGSIMIGYGANSNSVNILNNTASGVIYSTNALVMNHSSSQALDLLTNSGLIFQSNTLGVGGFNGDAIGASVNELALGAGTFTMQAGNINVGYQNAPSTGISTNEIIVSSGAFLVATGVNEVISLGQNVTNNTYAYYNLLSNAGTVTNFQLKVGLSGAATTNYVTNTGTMGVTLIYVANGGSNQVDTFGSSKGTVTDSGALYIGGQSGNGTTYLTTNSINTVNITGGNFTESGGTFLGTFSFGSSNSLNVSGGSVYLGGGATLGATTPFYTNGASTTTPTNNTNIINFSGGSLNIAGTLSATTNDASVVDEFNWSGGTLGVGSLTATNATWGGGVSSISNNTFYNTNTGTLAVGGSNAGKTFINGSYVQSNNASLALVIQGTNQASSYQQGNTFYGNLAVTNTASLYGNLLITVAGQNPNATNSYTIVTAAGGLANNLSGSNLVTINGTNEVIDTAGYNFFKVTTTANSLILTNYTLNQWIGGGGSWGSGGNSVWSVLDPNSSLYAAYFGTNGGGGSVLLNSNRTVFGLAFNNATNGYVLSGTSTLTLTNSPTGANTTNASISVTAGNQTVNVPILLGAGLVVSNSAGGTTLTLGGNISQAVSGLGINLSTNNTGLVYLGGSNSFTGVAAVNGGALELGVSNALSTTNITSNNLSVASNTIAVFAVGGTTPYTTGQIAAALSGGAFQSNSSVGYDASGTNYTMGNVAGLPVSTIYLAGNGTVTVAADNSAITNGATINGFNLVSGTLAVSGANNGNALGGSNNLLYLGGATALAGSNQVINLGSTTQTLGNLVNVNAAGDTVTLTNGSLVIATNTFVSLSGLNEAANASITAGGLNLSSYGGGSQAIGSSTLSGSNNFTTQVYLQGGSLSLNSSNALGGTPVLAFYGSSTLTSPGGYTNPTALQFQALGGATITVSGVMNFGASTLSLGGVLSPFGANINVTSNSIMTITGGITGSSFNNTGNLTNSGAGTLVIGTGDTSTGSITEAGGVLDLNGTTFTNTFTLSGGTIQNGTISNTATFTTLTNGAISAIIAGNVGLTQTGPGTLTLSGSNTYTGVTIVNSGAALEFANTNALYGANTNNWAATNITVNSNGILAFGVGTQSGAFVAGSTLDTIINALTNTSGNTNGFEAGAILGLDVSGANYTQPYVFTDSVNGHLGLAALATAGNGTLTLSIANTYTGETVVGTNATIVQGIAGGLGTGLLSNNGVVNIGGFATTVGGLTGSGIMTNSSGGTTLLTLTTTGTQIFAGSIVTGGSGDFSLLMNGAGTQTFSGSNTYAGNTTITNGGTLMVTNGGTIYSPNGIITIGQGSLTIAGTGTVTAGEIIATNGNTQTTNVSALVITQHGTLVTSNSTTAAQISLASNTTAWSINGNWIMNGGTNNVDTAGTLNPGYVYLGNNIPSNQITVNTGAVLSLGTNAYNTASATNNLNLAIGNNTAGTNNSLLVNGGTVTNVAQISFGANDSMTITNGGQVYVGNSGANGYSGINIANNNVNIFIGGTNSGGVSSILYGGNARLNLSGGAGSGSTNINVVVGQGGVITNTVVFLYGAYNTLTITNGGALYGSAANGGLQVGRTGTNDNVWIGGTNSVTGARSLVNNAGQQLTVGAGGGGAISISNTLTIGSGGLVTNVGAVIIGGNTTTDINPSINQIVITNGGQLFNSGYTIIGYNSNANSNSITIAGTNSSVGSSLWSAGGQNVYIGYNTGNYWYSTNTNAGVINTNTNNFYAQTTNNFVNVLTGGVLTNAGTVLIGGTNGSNALNLYGGSAYLAGVNLGATNTVTNVTIITTNNQVTNTNTYTNYGFLNFSNSGTNNGTLFATGNGNLIYGAGTVSFNGNGTINNNGFTVTNSVASVGAGGLTSAGSGTLFLTGVNNYAGVTTISGGTLEFANANALYNATTSSWTAANIVVNSNAVAAFNVGTNVNAFTTSNITSLLAGIDGVVTNNGLEAGSFIGLDATGTNFTLTNGISNTTGTGGGAVGLDSVGSGTLIVTSSNNYSGGTLVTGGSTLVVSNTYALGAITGNLNIVNGTLTNSSFNAAVGNVTLGNGSITGTGTLTATSYTATNTAQALISESLAGGGGLTNSGTGTTVLSGSNTFSGGVVVNSGILVVSNTYALGATNNSVNVAAGTLNNTSFNDTVGAVTVGNANISGAGTLTGASFTITNTAGVTISESLAGTGGLTVSGTTNVNLTGPNTYSGNTLLNGTTNSSLVVQSGGSIFSPLATLSVGSGSLVMNSGSAVTVASLIVTNGNTTNSTNSFFTFSGGTLTTTNASNAIAANILGGNTTSWTVNGVWNMEGGTNIVEEVSATNQKWFYVGSGLNNAAVNIYSNAVLTLGSNASGTSYADYTILIGNAGNTNNSMTVNGGMVTNVYQTVLGNGAGGNNNSLVITNGGLFYGGTVTIGTASSANSNSVTIGGTNTAGGLSIMDLGTGSMTVGNGTTGLGNTLTVGSGGLVTNASTIELFGSSGVMTVTNGGQVSVYNGGNPGNVALGVGANDGGNSNNLLIGGTNAAGTPATVNLGGSRLAIGDGGAISGGGHNSTNNSVVIGAGGIVTNAVLEMYSVNSSLTITNGGALYITPTTGIAQVGRSNSVSNTVVIGGTNSVTGASATLNGGGVILALAGFGGNESSNTILVGAGGLITNVSDIYIAGYVSGAVDTNNSGNQLIITNGGQVYSTAASSIGYQTNDNSNSVTIAGNNALWNLGGSTLTVGVSTNASNNTLTVASGGILTNGNVVLAGTASYFSVNGTANLGTVNVASSGTGTLYLGTGGNLTVNSLLVTNNNSSAINGIFNFSANGGILNTTNATNAIAADILVSNNAIFEIDGTWNMQGGSNLIVSVATNGTPGSAYIGYGGTAGSNAAVNVNAGAVWSLGTNAITTSAATNDLGIYLGDNFTNNNNVLTVNGGIVTNASTLQIGNGATNASGSQLVITNGGQMFVGASGQTTSIYVNGSSETILIGGSNGTTNSILSAGGNRMNLGSTSGANNDTVTVAAGGVLTNANLYIYGISNTVTLTNGGQFFGIGSAYVGRGGTNDSLLIGSTTGTNSVANLGGTPLAAGGGGNPNSISNTIQVGSGGIITNVSDLLVGGQATGDTNSFGNQLIITNGGQVYSSSSNWVGLNTNNNSNSITVAGTNSSGGNSIWNAGGGAIYIGMTTYTTAISNNALNVLNGGILTNAGSVVLADVNSSFNLSGTAYVSGVNLSTNSATLNFTNIGSTNGTLVATANGNLISGTGTVNFNGNATISSGAFVVTNSAATLGIGSLTKIGTGTLVLSASNSYTGGTVVSTGMLTLGNANALGSTNGALTINGTLNMAGFNEDQDGFTGSGTVTNSAAGASTLTVGVSNSSSTFTGKLVSGTGAVALIQDGTGTLTLTGSNSYTGGTTVQAGTLSVNNTNAIGSGVLMLASNTVFQYSGASGTLANAIQAMAGTSFIQNSGAGTLTLGGLITKQNSVLEFEGGSYNVTGQITGGSIGDSLFNSDLILSNAVVTLSHTNDYYGPTYLEAGSTLLDGIANALPVSTVLNIGSVSDLSTVTNAFDLRGYNQSIAGLTNAGSATALVFDSVGGGTLTLTGSSSFSGSIGGGSLSSAMALVISGGATTVTLTGNNTYTGSTIITNGSTLDLSSTGQLSGTSNVVINGSTLLLGGTTGVGKVNPIDTNAVLTMNGGTLSMGGLTGTTRTASQTFASLTLTGNSTIDFSSLTGTSSLTFGTITMSGNTLDIFNYDQNGSTTHLYDSAGPSDLGVNLANINFFSDNGSSFLGTGQFNGNEIIAVPEPGVIVSALLLLGCLLFPQRGRLARMIARRFTS